MPEMDEVRQRAALNAIELHFDAGLVVLANGNTLRFHANLCGTMQNHAR